MILTLRALGLGDLLTGVPALRATRRAFPSERIALAAPAALAGLARWAAPIDTVVPTEGLVPLDPSVRRATLAVNLHGRGPESTALLAATVPDRLVAFDVDGCPSWDPEEHERSRWCRLLVESGLVDQGDADPDDLRIGAPPVPAGLSERVEGATVVHPGASAEARRWPADRWAAVAAAEASAGRRVVVTGSTGERPLAKEVARRAGLGAESVLAGATDVLELVAVVAAAGRVVCGDTGIAHVASAVGTPSVVLFGPVSPAQWGPPPTGPHIALWAGERGDPHADRPALGLLAIEVDDVLAAL